MTLASRLRRAQTNSFVGRAKELGALADALDPASEPGLLFVLGPVGIGKTTLMRHFGALASERGVRSTWTSASIADFRTSITSVMRALHGRAKDARQILFVDTFHQLTSTDQNWFLCDCLPGFPANTLVVVAKRKELPLARVGSETLIAPFSRRLELAPFDRGEALEYLARCEVAPHHRSRVLTLALGVPLLLFLAADLVAQGKEPTPRSLERAVVTQLGHEISPLLDTHERRIALAIMAVVPCAVY